MANEVTIPLLPCASIDEVAEFYVLLGFTITFRRRRPNAYLSVRREDINLHFFGIPGYDPEQSHSSCLVQVEDPREHVAQQLNSRPRKTLGWKTPAERLRDLLTTT